MPCVRRCCYRVGDEVRAEFESQFAYAGQLFEEVFDSNAIHVRYPLLFLNKRADMQLYGGGWLMLTLADDPRARHPLKR